MVTSNLTDLPGFLRSFENLTGHFDEQFEPLSGNERGDQFLALAKKIAPLTDEGQRFPQPEHSEKKSHDDGVDLLTCRNQQNEMLCIQSKFKIKGKDEIDSIISKFSHFETTRCRKPAAGDLFVAEGNATLPFFMIVTASKLEGVLKAYEESALLSKEHFRKLISENRLFLVDGPRILLSILQRLYAFSGTAPGKSGPCGAVRKLSPDLFGDLP
jgi:hypothetical protein